MTSIAHTPTAGVESELMLTSAVSHADPLREVDLLVDFTAPGGRRLTRNGFWDGGDAFRVRVWANEEGAWKYATRCAGDASLHGRMGTFEVAAANPMLRPLRVSENGHYLQTDDGKPFFWLSDTAWNGALHSSDDDWRDYLADRRSKGFTAVQFVTTQWRACRGNREGQVAYGGRDRISVNPAFFRQMDQRIAAVREAGLLPAPVLLWALGEGSPGVDLPADQAALLARYMLGRWGGAPVLFILGGDGDYRGRSARRWHEIGRGAFRPGEHRPLVAMHCGGQTFPLDELRDEPWFDVMGYQSGHGDGAKHIEWLVNGPPSEPWVAPKTVPIINMEPNYEGILAYHSKQPISPLAVRRAAYWSCLTGPTAGVSYGTNGIWWWSPADTPEVPLNHPCVGIAPPWREAAALPGAGQMKFVREVFERVEWWELRSSPDLVARQPGRQSPERFIAASQTPDGSAVIVYIPADRQVHLALPAAMHGLWIDPRTGKAAGDLATAAGPATLHTPGDGDWVLVLRRK